MTEQSLAIRSLYLAPVVDIQEAVDKYNAVNQFVSSILKKGTDYGEVPGSDKPTLLKPGAEKMISFFGLSPRFILEEKMEDWTGENHNGEPFFYYRYKCQLYRGEFLIAEGEGSCNSWEKKYRYRWMNEADVPPYVDKSRLEFKDGAISEFSFAIDKAETSGKYGKPEAYWKQFKDAIANGTAKKFKKKARDKEYDAYEIGGRLYAVPNHDPAEQVNTIQKMAQKRSLIAPVLLATNTSEMFTQDIEDFQSPVSEPIFDAEFTPVQPVQTTRTTQPAPANNGYKEAAPFTLAECENMQTSDGKRYGDLSTTDILNRLNAMSKAKNPDDARMLKIEMTKHLLAARNRGESPEPAGLVETAEQLGGQQN